MTHLAQGDPRKAIPYLDQAVRISPDYRDAYFHRGGAHLRQKEFRQAQRDFSDAIRLGFSNAQVYACRASAELNLGDSEAAVADATRAIDLDGKFSEAFRAVRRPCAPCAKGGGPGRFGNGSPTWAGLGPGEECTGDSRSMNPKSRSGRARGGARAASDSRPVNRDLSALVGLIALEMARGTAKQDEWRPRIERTLRAAALPRGGRLPVRVLFPGVRVAAGTCCSGPPAAARLSAGTVIKPAPPTVRFLPVHGAPGSRLC